MAAPLWVYQTAQRINARRITVIISKLTTAIIKYEMVVTKSGSVIWWNWVHSLSLAPLSRESIQDRCPEQCQEDDRCQHG